MTNNLFNGLQVVSGEVKAELVNDSVDIEVSFRGEVALTKGNFEQTQNYYFNRCEVTRYGYVECDDWDIEEGYSKLGGLPIDSLHQLKETLINSGLSTLANSLGFDDAEKRKAVFLAIENSKNFKKQYGKNAKVWRALTDAEQKVVRLGYVIENFDTSGDHDKRNFGIKSYDEEGEEIKNYVPRLDELKTLKETLTQL